MAHILQLAVNAGFDRPGLRTTMASTGNQCAVCYQPAGKLCSGCKNIHYCSVECFTSDWKAHKMLCRSFKDLRNPPHPMMMRVIVFSYYSRTPDFRWIPIKEGTIQRPLEDHYFVNQHNLSFEFPSFCQHPKTGKQLPLRITIQGFDSDLTDSIPLNQCVHHLTDGHPFQKFSGPLVVYGNALEGNEINIKHINLDTTHLNIIRDYFNLGPYISEHEPIYQQRLHEDFNIWYDSQIE